MSNGLKTFVIGPELERVDTEDQVVYIKGHYIINRENEDYSEYDTDDKSISERKEEKVMKLHEKYNIDEGKLNRKIIFCVVLPFCLISFIHYITRFSITCAAEVGLKEDLHLSEKQYNIASAAFFIPYVIFELLSNLVLKYVRPHYFMSFYVFMLGITVLANGFVTNFAGLVVCRMFSGLFQSNSSALYYVLANYFANHNSLRVFTAYYSFGTIGGMLSFLLINAVKTLPSLPSWTWLYVIEGIVTMVFGVVLFFIIPDFPEGARFLNDDETIFLVKKLEVYNGKSGYQLHITGSDIFNVFKDPILWWGTLVYFGLLGCSYGTAYLIPAIVTELSADNIGAGKLLLEATPFILALLIANSVAFTSDMVKKRAPFAGCAMLLALAGLILMVLYIENPKVRYYGAIMSVTGLSTAVPIIVCWVSMNFGGHLRKNVSTAWLVSFASISGMISVFTFDSNDSPNYSKGIWTDIGFIGFSFVFLIVYVITLFQESKKKTYQSYRTHFDNLSSREKTFLGDKNPLFKYIL